MDAKLDRPYTDFPHLVDCHKLNGLNMGLILYSEKSCQVIINSISSDMQSNLCKEITRDSSKVFVMVDESTNVAGKCCLVIHVKAILGGQPTHLFLDIVDLLLLTCYQQIPSLAHVLY